MNIKISAILASALIATTYGCIDSNKVSPATLEDARAQAKANSELNAELYRAANPRYTGDFQIISRADSHQTLECPQGDGFTDLNMLFIDPVDKKKVEKVPLKCSTVSISVGCYRTEDFVKMPEMVRQEGVCLNDYHLPLPALSTSTKR
jgi:hypothetical protein